MLKIFTALLLERRILIVSKDLENLTSCALSLEHLIYPLEWLHAFVPIMPEHIDIYVYNQPFPFIYGVHKSIYDKLNKAQLEDAVVLLIDEKQVLNADKDRLPDNIANSIRKKLKFFNDNSTAAASSSSSSHHHHHHQYHQHHNDDSSSSNQLTNSISRLNGDKYELLLSTGPIQAFLDAVLMIIDDYREYLVFDAAANEFKFNEDIYFQMKDVQTAPPASNDGNKANKYISNENEFYHEFRITQAFEEVQYHIIAFY